jgi:chemotaxis methyl-accepting protein methylase
MKSHPAMTAKLTEEELDEISALIEQRSAILFDSSRERFFSTRVREHLEEKGLGNGTELLRHVRGSSTEYESLLERLLTQETSFFRYPAIYEALA